MEYQVFYNIINENKTFKIRRGMIMERMGKKEQKKFILAFFIKLGVLCLAFWSIFTFIFGTYRLCDGYMYPQLREDDLLFYYRLANDYRVDDVVVFSVNGERKVARIVATEGDVVEISSEGKLMVNGHICDENSMIESLHGVTFPYQVEEDSYFLMYDYRLYCDDSREFGAVSRKNMDGKVFTILRHKDI
jgi:signal peptidase I